MVYHHRGEVAWDHSSVEDAGSGVSGCISM